MDNRVEAIIGAKIHNLRTAAGLSQKTFGEACRPVITMQQVSKYEHGQNSISAARLLDFARILSCSPLELFSGCSETVSKVERASRSDYEIMNDYQALPGHMKDSVRGFIRLLAKEIRS